MNKIAFSGTLDPITNGHLWVIGEARALADEVVVLISENPFKKPLFPAEQRKAIVENALAERGWSNVSVLLVRGDYTSRAAKRHGINYMIRGIRNNADFDYENLLQQANVDVVEGAKTLFVMPPRDLGSVSSTFVRGLQGPVGWHWSMKKFVPKAAYDAWVHAWLRKEWEELWHYGSLEAADVLNADRWFTELTGDQAYNALHRAYHNLDHLVHGLTELTVWAANEGADPASVRTLKAAFWFHDAVYKAPRAVVSNEEASAQLWMSSGLAGPDPTHVAKLIRCTDHAQPGSEMPILGDVILGADLSILGQSDAVYKNYRASVRQEYAWVEEAVYCAARRNVLNHFIAAAETGRLFQNQYFKELYELKALQNLRQEVSE